MQVLTTVCRHRRAFGADEVARDEARAALTCLTDRERAMFAMSLLTQIETPALCGLMGFISDQVKQHGERLYLAATKKN